MEKNNDLLSWLKRHQWDHLFEPLSNADVHSLSDLIKLDEDDFSDLLCELCLNRRLERKFSKAIVLLKVQRRTEKKSKSTSREVNVPIAAALKRVVIPVKSEIEAVKKNQRRKTFKGLVKAKGSAAPKMEATPFRLLARETRPIHSVGEERNTINQPLKQKKSKGSIRAKGLVVAKSTKKISIPLRLRSRLQEAIDLDNMQSQSPKRMTAPPPLTPLHQLNEEKVTSSYMFPPPTPSPQRYKGQRNGFRNQDIQADSAEIANDVYGGVSPIETTRSIPISSSMPAVAAAAARAATRIRHESLINDKDRGDIEEEKEKVHKILMKIEAEAANVSKKDIAPRNVKEVKQRKLQLIRAEDPARLRVRSSTPCQNMNSMKKEAENIKPQYKYLDFMGVAGLQVQRLLRERPWWTEIEPSSNIITEEDTLNDKDAISAKDVEDLTISLTVNGIKTGLGVKAIPALFGPKISNNPSPNSISKGSEVSKLQAELRCAEPLTAHKDLVGKSQQVLKGCIALVERGKCSYAEKAIRCQAAGAIGCLVCQTEKTWPVLMQEKNTKRASMVAIPTFIVCRDDANRLLQVTGFDGMIISAHVKQIVRLNGDSQKSMASRVKHLQALARRKKKERAMRQFSLEKAFVSNDYDLCLCLPKIKVWGTKYGGIGGTNAHAIPTEKSNKEKRQLLSCFPNSDYLSDRTKLSQMLDEFYKNIDADIVARVVEKVNEPMLIDNKKFALRIWVTMVSINKSDFRCFVHRDGYICLDDDISTATEEKDEKDSTLHFRSLDWLQLQFNKKFETTTNVSSDIMPKIHQIVHDTAKAACKRGRIDSGNKGRASFELFQYHFHFNKDGEVSIYFIEGCPVLKIYEEDAWFSQLNSNVARDLIEIAIDPIFPPPIASLQSLHIEREQRDGCGFLEVYNAVAENDIVPNDVSSNVIKLKEESEKLSGERDGIVEQHSSSLNRFERERQKEQKEKKEKEEDKQKAVDKAKIKKQRAMKRQKLAERAQIRRAAAERAKKIKAEKESLKAERIAARRRARIRRAERKRRLQFQKEKERLAIERAEQAEIAKKKSKPDKKNVVLGGKDIGDIESNVSSKARKMEDKAISEDQNNVMISKSNVSFYDIETVTKLWKQLKIKSEAAEEMEQRKLAQEKKRAARRARKAERERKAARRKNAQQALKNALAKLSQENSEKISIDCLN
eukprot:g5102.t1